MTTYVYALLVRRHAPGRDTDVTLYADAYHAVTVARGFPTVQPLAIGDHEHEVGIIWAGSTGAETIEVRRMEVHGDG